MQELPCFNLAFQEFGSFLFASVQPLYGRPEIDFQIYALA
jgi:hypothetical protein